jgi:hypothetical protein
MDEVEMEVECYDYEVTMVMPMEARGLRAPALPSPGRLE